MCQYRYHYYGHCRHQEFILVKLCEGAVPLAHFDKHQQKHNTEGASVKAPPADTTAASLCAVESDLSNTEPSIVLTGEVDHSIHPSSNILHIVVSAMAPDTNEMRLVSSLLSFDSVQNLLTLNSDHEQEFAQEAERRYNDIISGGRPPAYYKAIEIQLQQVLDRVRQLGNPSSSAAVRLQELHEHNGQSSGQTVSTSPSTPAPMPLENFPALSLTTRPRNDALIQSYAKAVKNSLPQPLPVVAQASEPHVPFEPQIVSRISDQDEDGDWHLVDRSGRGTRSQKQHATVTERHVRKSLPKAWMQMDDDVHTPWSTPENVPLAPHSSPNKPLQRTARVKGPHNQLAQAQADSLKSKPSKPTLTKATASKTPGYASPTKASKHRTAGTSEAARSPSPCKLKSVRVDTMSSAAMSPSEQQSPTRSVASAVFDASRRKVLPVHGRYAPTSFPFGLDGTFEFDQTSMLQSFSGNSVRPSKKAKLNLRINIPDPSSSLPRPASPSRIPIAVSPNTLATDVEPVTPKCPTAQVVEVTEAGMATSKPIDRASILDPIRRRLSSASSSSSTSQRRSSTSSTGRPRRDSGATQSKEMACVGDNSTVTKEPDMFNESDVTITETSAQKKTQQSSNTVPSSLMTKLEPASALLLDTIKQTAEAHAFQQSISLVKTSVAPSSSMDEAHQAEKLREFQAACRSKHISCASSPDKDPAVVRCGPVKAQTSKSQPRSTSGPARSSLRATAAHFVPTPTSEEEFGPLSAPEPAFRLPLPPAPSTLVAPTLGLAPLIGPTVLPVCPPILPMAVSQQLTTQCPSALDDCPSWIPDEEWYDLPFETKTAILRERRERRSSSASSPGTSSAIFSNFATSPPLSSLGPVDPGMNLYKPQWDWMNPGQSGVRFGRAPLPTMPDLQDDGHQRRGWDVKSAAPGWRYGWCGGDGLEISFKGDGPVAERNPNAPVNFNEYDNDSYGKPTKKGQKYGGRPWSKKNGRSPNNRVREWARNANYPSIPCGNFEVIQATEHLPNFSDAWCHSCLPAHM
ncbi:unnamed protein product [Aureobasidium vineae]|uniref:Uncharacterized protein n=1 Tax=Aureobasidium vineae TaxID=2773715 RepID=A0A9N8JD23_9PEZI|nr:unnamed protein product [Aureobasidium vineae]